MRSTTSTRRTQAGEQFVAITNAPRETAQAYLRNNNYNLDAALNQYFADRQNDEPNEAALAPIKARLNELFDELVPEDERNQADRSGKPAAAIDAEACQAYIQRVGADPDSYEMFVVLETVQAEAIGSITRAGFVEGWARVAAASGGRVGADWASQKRHVRARVAAVASDPAYFKTLYDFAFRIGKEPAQKALDMGFALAFWGVLFAPTMNSWRSARVNWLEAWAAYLKEKYGVVRTADDGEEEVEYKRTVSRDLWSQTRLFAAKTMEDETLSFWSEEQAWPGLIDEFVVWCREKGVVPRPNGEQMDTE